MYIYNDQCWYCKYFENVDFGFHVYVLCMNHQGEVALVFASDFLHKVLASDFLHEVAFGFASDFFQVVALVWISSISPTPEMVRCVISPNNNNNNYITSACFVVSTPIWWSLRPSCSNWVRQPWHWWYSCHKTFSLALRNLRWSTMQRGSSFLSSSTDSSSGKVTMPSIVSSNAKLSLLLWCGRLLTFLCNHFRGQPTNQPMSSRIILFFFIWFSSSETMVFMCILFRLRFLGFFFPSREY